jgi:hypothetical protein
MPPKRIRYGQLYSYLESLGYRPETGPTYFVYRHLGTRLPIFLPKRPKTEEASKFNLLAVQHTLELEEVVGAGHLFFTINGATPKRKTKAAKPKAPSPKAAKPRTTGAKAAKAGGS